MGELLEQRGHMPLAMVEGLFSFGKANELKKLALLGGEPTLHPRVTECVERGFAVGFKEVRIVTNGTAPLRSFIRSYSGPRKPTLVFSVDGATASMHDGIRGNGAFANLTKSRRLALDKGYRIAGITSIGKSNYSQARDIVRLADQWGFEYLSIHSTNPRGFAATTTPLSPPEWRALYDRLIAATRDLRVAVRFERRFLTDAELAALPASHADCFVRSESGGNLLCLPDGRIFKCALFVGAGATHSYFWDGTEIRFHTGITEEDVCRTQEIGCPVWRRESTQSYAPYIPTCIYRKEVIAAGKVSPEI